MFLLISIDIHTTVCQYKPPTHTKQKTNASEILSFSTMCLLSSLDMFGFLVTKWTDHSQWDIIHYSGRQRLEILERAELHDLIQVHAVLRREWHHRLATPPEITCIATISYKLFQGQQILWTQRCVDSKFAGEKNMRFKNLLRFKFFIDRVHRNCVPKTNELPSCLLLSILTEKKPHKWQIWSALHRQ